jgi:hypothetical protein
MAGVQSGYRNRLFRAVHVEGQKRGFDHDALRDLCAERYGVHSMSALTDGQLAAVYHSWTGKGLRRRAALPQRGEALKAKAETIVSGEELLELDREFATRGLGESGRLAFIRRQLRGRDQIRTRKDWVKIITPLRRMNRRTK